jgi:copper transport protein
MVRLLALLFAIAVALSPGAARAHAALVRADPADGQVLPAAPARVHLSFNEPVRPLVVRLFEAGGRVLRELAVERHDGTIMVAMPPDLGTGSHVLSYRVISTDGHPVAGSLTFSVGEAGGTAVRPIESASGTGSLLWLSRVVLYAGLLIGVGGAFFRAWLTPDLRDRATTGLLVSALGAGALAASAAPGLQGLDALGRPLADVTSPDIWRAGLDTTYGRTVVAALLALAAAAASLVVRDATSRKGLSLAALVGTGVAFAVSGHASSAPPQWLTRPAILIHGVAIAYWIGALAPLAVLLRRGEPGILKIVRRFSDIAVPAVAALVITGAVLAWIQVRDPAALLATAYGRILIAKVGLVVALLALAAINRFRLTPALGQGRPAERRLSASAVAELVMVASILSLVGLWRFTPPPRVVPIESPAEQPAVAHLHASHAMAEIILDPGRVGPTRARVALSGTSGPIEPKEVTVRLSNKPAGLEPFERRAIREADGTWVVDGLALPVPGRWAVEVEALISDFEKVILTGEVEVRL